MERTCESCSATFEARPYKIAAGKARYCSRQCYRDAVKRDPKHCEQCGIVIPETGWHHEAKFCSAVCYHARGRSHWTGGKRTEKDGYIHVWLPEHPMARSDGYVLEHRLVMADSIGRDLESHEVVHHINGVRDDNRIENLEVFASHSEHMKHHALS